MPERKLPISKLRKKFERCNILATVGNVQGITIKNLKDSRDSPSKLNANEHKGLKELGGKGIFNSFH